jgi:hypothetical protein
LEAPRASGRTPSRAFFRKMTDWHRWLGASPEVGRSRPYRRGRASPGRTCGGSRPECAILGPVFTIDRGTSGQPQKRGTLTVSTRTADVVKWEPFSALSTGRQWRSYLRFAHTGEVAGVAGQTIAGLASLGGAFLVYTGISLAIRRVWAWRARPVAAAAARQRARESMLDA